MRIAVIGKSGQLARALIARAASHDVDITAYDRSACDLSQDADKIEAFISSLETDAVIIAAAYTAVDTAEDDYDMALAVNALAPAAIARACSRRNLPLVHVSTDYVFKGDANAPYAVGAPTDPINAYGLSKLNGEYEVLNANLRAAVLRTSWVFDGRGKNFLTTMLRLGASRENLSVVSDQIGRPTYAGHLANACILAAKGLADDGGLARAGLYHVTGTGEPMSWADFAAEIFKAAKDHLPHAVTVTPIPSKDYLTPAARPAYSVLETSHFEDSFGALPHWRAGLKEAIFEWEQTLKV